MVLNIILNTVFIRFPGKALLYNGGGLTYHRCPPVPECWHSGQDQHTQQKSKCSFLPKETQVASVDLVLCTD